METTLQRCSLLGAASACEIHSRASPTSHCSQSARLDRQRRPFSSGRLRHRRGQSGCSQRHDCRRLLTCAAQAADAVTVAGTKAALLQALEGTDRGIFGVPAEKREAILALIAQLEAHGSTEGITGELERVSGDWRLLFSTIAITGKRRTKLGLRNFISLGDFTQRIDTQRNLAINAVAFSVSGIAMLKGALCIEASYAVHGPRRVAIDFESATLEPAQLQALFEANYDLLLSIFNPAGWLDITYLDERHRVGRDDKSNVFLLERV